MRPPCQATPDLFFDSADGSRPAALKACARCDVRPECLELAMGHERGLGRSGRYGIWGGLTPNERNTLEKRRNAS